MKHLGISGGGTKIAGLFGVAEAIIYDKGYRPDIISGVSAGAVLALPLALGKRDEIRELVLHLEFNTFFSKTPVKKSGSIRLWNALGQVIGGKHYFGKQGNLEKILQKVVPRAAFETYKKDDQLPICLVGSVDFYTGKRFYINLKEVDYEDFPKFVNASSSIPLFTPGVAFDKPITDFEGKQNRYHKVLLYDGGVRDHSPSHKILESRHPRFQVTETCSIYSRPKDIRDIINPKDFTPKNLMKILERYVEITNAEISKNDERIEQKIIRAKGILDRGTFYLPRIMQGVYDVDNTRLRQLYEVSKKLADTGFWEDEKRGIT